MPWCWFLALVARGADIPRPVLALQHASLRYRQYAVRALLMVGPALFLAQPRANEAPSQASAHLA